MPKGVHNNHPKMEQHGRWKGGIRIERGYVLVRQPNHPRVRKTGHVKRAILVLEKKLGRFLLPEGEAHHIDENKQNDDPDNLECKTHVAHARHHAGKRRRRETRTCVICGVNVTRRPSYFQVSAERTTCGFRCRNILNAGVRDEKGRFSKKEKED